MLTAYGLFFQIEFSPNTALIFTQEVKVLAMKIRKSESAMDIDGTPHLQTFGSAEPTINQEPAWHIWCHAIRYHHIKYCLWSLSLVMEKSHPL